jgi:ParB-like nuclease domain
MNVVEMDLSNLKPAPYNPRKKLKPDSTSYRKLKASLETFGLVEPIVWNKRTGFVVGGHARLQIWKDLGHTTAPTHVIDIDEAKEKALNVVLNNREAQSRFDPNKLHEVLKQLDSCDSLQFSGMDKATIRTLEMSPADLPPLTDAGDVVRISLVCDRKDFYDIESDLNALLQRHAQLRIES